MQAEGHRSRAQMKSVQVVRTPRLVVFVRLHEFTMSEETPQTEKCIDRSNPTNRCSYCGHEFVPKKSRSVLIRGPGDVYCGCPQCGRSTWGIAPSEVASPASPPVVGIDHISYSVSEMEGIEYTTVGIVFPNETRLQYRECADGHVREEVISAVDMKFDSISIGSGVNVFTALAGEIERYRRLSESGLYETMPHVAAALLDER